MANDQQNGGGKQYNGAPLGGVRIAKRGRDTDPASKIPGMPPNMGMDVVPHIDTFSGRIGSYAQTYRNSDEAIKHSVANAEAMRNDCGIMECVEARQRATALLPWHLEPDDPENPEQAALAEMLQRILEAIPRFTEYRMNLMHAVWYGRYGVAQRFRWMDVRGQQVIGIDKWRPIHGDKLIFRYDDGDHTVDEDQIGIRVGGMFNAGQKIGAGEWELQEVSQVLPTDTGLAYFLEPYERPLVAIHKHMIEDGPFELPIDAGAIHGRGIRSRIYWTWFHMQECLSWLLEYLERSAFGIEVWYYAWGNEESRAATETAARKRLGAGRNILLVPRPIGDDAPAYGVEHVEPGMAGASEVRSIVEQYFGWRIKRYILGQILTSETDATGLGSSVADLHKLTFDAIIEYDARNLEETITRDCLKHIQRFNAPGSEGVNIRFKIDTKSDDALEKMQMFEAAWNMGFMLDAKDVGKLVGAKPAQEQTPYLLAPQYIQMQMQLAQMAAPQQQPGQQPGQPAQGGQSIDPAALQAIMAQAGIQPGTPDAAMLEQAAAQAGGSTPQAVASGLQYFSRASNSLRIRNQAKNLHGQIERFALKKNIASPAVAAAPGQPLAAGPGGDSSSGVAPAAEKYAATQPSSPSPWSHAAANVWPGLMTPDQFIDGEAWLKHRLKPYLDDLGNQIASSRETPSTFTMPPIGSWRIDPMKLSHGRMIDQLVVLNPHSLEATEDLVPTNAEGRGWDSDRYREWMKQGKESPPITVVQTDEGTLRVTDGHRRLFAHRRLNKPIKAWVSWAAHLGQNDSQGKPMGTNLTYELAKEHGPAVLMHPQTTSAGVAKYAAGEAESASHEEPMPVKDILRFLDLDNQKPRSLRGDQRSLMRAAREIAIHHAMHPRGSAEELALATALHHIGRFVHHIHRGLYMDSFLHKRRAEEILRGYESGTLPGPIAGASELAELIRAGKFSRNHYRAFSPAGQTNLASAGLAITPGAMVLAANRLPDYEVTDYFERPGQSEGTWDTAAAVDSYRSHGHALNRMLRRGLSESGYAETPAVFRHLDDLMAHPASAIRHPMTVYRGFGSEVRPKEIGIGGTIVDAGYSSTTADPTYAASYSGETGGPDSDGRHHIAAIHLPEGTHAPYISEHDGAENEVLLPRRAKFTKIGDQETKPGHFDPDDTRSITVHHFVYEPIGHAGKPGLVRHARQDDSDAESRFVFGNGVSIVRGGQMAHSADGGDIDQYEDSDGVHYAAVDHGDDLGYLGGSSGGQGARLVRDAKGTHYVHKAGASPEHIQSEHLARQAYRLLGARSPNSVLVSGGKEMLSEYLHGARNYNALDDNERAAAEPEIAKHFVADALMANWDTLGADGDNIMVDQHGHPWRVDAGGALDFRGLGARKGVKFGPNVGEIDTMRSPRYSTGAHIFSRLTPDQIHDQIRDAVAKRESLLAIFRGNPVQRTLASRLDHLASMLPENGGAGVKPVEPVAIEDTPYRFAMDSGGQKYARAWHFTRDDLAEAINAHDRQTLEAARPLLADMFPEYTAEYDPWGIHRAIHRGDELPRIPMVQFTAKHKKLVLDAIARGEHVPPNVAAEYQVAPASEPNQ